MAGRDSDFEARRKAQLAAKQNELAGGKVIEVQTEQENPDPRTNIPFTMREIMLRQCYHEMTRIAAEDGSFIVYRFTIIDPMERNVYHYTVREPVLKEMIQGMQEMLDFKEPDVTT